MADPFEKLRQKVVASQVIEDSVQSFLMMDSDAQQMEKRGCIDEAQAKRLAMDAINKLVAKKIHAQFTDFDFETGFRIYAKDGVVPKRQLSNFVKNVADL